MTKAGFQILLIALIFISTTPTTLSAVTPREKLEEMGIRYTEEEFREQICSGNKVAVESFLSAGMDPNMTIAETPVIIVAAIHCGQLGSLAVLLEAGADPNATDDDGRPALFHALLIGHEMADLLIKHGADVDAEFPDGATSLTATAEGGDIDSVRFLLKNGADPNVKTDEGLTPLMYARKNNHEEVAKLLLDSGAEKPDEASKRKLRHLEREAQRSQCEHNLKQLSMVLTMFALEKGGRFPRVDDVEGNFIIEGAALYPKYIADPQVFGCPGDSGFKDTTTFRLRNNSSHPGSASGNIHADCFTCESYIYLGCVLRNEREGLAALTAYKSFGPNFIDSTSSVLPLARSVPEPATVPVIWEWPTNHEGGGHVLYLDRHIEFVSYPGRFPMTEKFMEALRKIEPQLSDDCLPIATK